MNRKSSALIIILLVAIGILAIMGFWYYETNHVTIVQIHGVPTGAGYQK